MLQNNNMSVRVKKVITSWDEYESTFAVKNPKYSHEFQNVRAYME